MISKTLNAAAMPTGARPKTVEGGFYTQAQAHAWQRPTEVILGGISTDDNSISVSVARCRHT